MGKLVSTHGLLSILCLLLAIYAPPASAETDDDCMEIQEDLTLQLSAKFKSSDKAGLAARRSYLNSLLGTASRSCATTLLYRLQNTKQSDLTLYELFHHRLARATQEELLDVLKVRFTADFSTSGIEVNDAPGDVVQGQASLAETQLGTAVDEAHETDIQCMQVQADLTTVLSKKYTSSDKEGLRERRKLLNRLAQNTTPSCAMTLKTRLGRQPNDSSLSVLFHHKLAAPTRNEILDVLDERSGSHARVIEGDLEIGITPDMVEAAAKRAKRILAGITPTNDNWRSLEKLECIVGGLEANPAHFDDSYFPVAPAGVNVQHTDNPWTCYKEPNFFTREPSCRKGKSVVDHCRSSFSGAIVNANIAVESDQELLELMLAMEDAINRGLAYFSNMRGVAGHLGGSENKNASLCKSAAEYLVPRMSSSNSEDRIYNCYPDP